MYIKPGMSAGRSNQKRDRLKVAVLTEGLRARGYDQDRPPTTATWSCIAVSAAEFELDQSRAVDMVNGSRIISLLFGMSLGHKHIIAHETLTASRQRRPSDHRSPGVHGPSSSRGRAFNDNLCHSRTTARSPACNLRVQSGSRSLSSSWRRASPTTGGGFVIGRKACSISATLMPYA